MDSINYQSILKKHKIKEDRLKNGLKAFLSGGLIGLIGELLANFYAYIFEMPKVEANTYMIVTLIFLGCILTCLGVFDKLVRLTGAGLIIPITGFAHSVMSATLEYRKEGLVTGIGTNMLKLAGTVIIYGVISAFIFGIIRLYIFGGNI